MLRENVKDLTAFMAVARERSITKAALQLGIAQPSLSQTIRNLEVRLGVRLLTRNAKGVTLTEVGDRFLRSIEPHFEGIEAGLIALAELRKRSPRSLRERLRGTGTSIVDR